MRQHTAATHIADLSVAISTRDRPDMLARCLDALLGGEVLPAEIIVVDQSLDDRTRLVVEQRQTHLCAVRYIPDAGRGLGISQNIAFTGSTSPIVAVIDDDCLPPRSWVAHIDQAFRQREDLDAVTGPVLPLGPDVPGQYPVSTRTGTERREFEKTAMPWEIGSGNNFAVRRDWLVRIGGNDERLGPGAPGQGGVDMDLFYRLLRAGARICYEPENVVYHERTTRHGRLARRKPYGYGMGACCMIWLRQGDRNALRVFGHWLLLRLWRLAGAVRRREWRTAYEELLTLWGTAGGVVFGLRIAHPA